MHTHTDFTDELLAALFSFLILALIVLALIADHLKRKIKILKKNYNDACAEVVRLTDIRKIEKGNIQLLEDKIRLLEQQLDNPPKYKVGDEVGSYTILTRTFVPKPWFKTALKFSDLFLRAAHTRFLTGKKKLKAINEIMRDHHRPDTHCYWKYEVKSPLMPNAGKLALTETELTKQAKTKRKK